MPIVRVSIPASWSNSPYAIAAGISLASGLALALPGTPFLHFLALGLLLLCTPVVLALTVICVAMDSACDRVKRAGQAFRKTLGVLLCVGLAQLPGCSTGWAIHRMHVSRAKAWCEELGANLEARGWGVLHVVHQVARLLDLGARRRIHLNQVNEPAFVNADTGTARSARLGTDTHIAIQTLGHDAGQRGLAHAARAGEQVSMMQPAGIQGVDQRLQDMSLTHHVRERTWPPFSCEDLITHLTGVGHGCDFIPAAGPLSAVLGSAVSGTKHRNQQANN